MLGKLKTVIACLLVMSMVFVTGCGKPESGGVETEDTGSDNVELEISNSMVIEGVEYIDSSRDIDNVSKNNFSFHIDNEKTKYLTYINDEEEPKVYAECIYLDSAISKVGVSFSNEDRVEIVVSDGSFTADGEKLITDNKTLLFKEKKLSCYSEPYKEGYISHEIIADIDGEKVSFIFLSETEGDEGLIEDVKYLIDHLSVNKKVGFYVDHYLSDAFGNMTFKSHELISRLKLKGGSAIDTDHVILNGQRFNYNKCIDSLYHVPEKMVVYTTIGEWKIGYYIEDSILNDYLNIFRYESEMLGDEEIMDGNQDFLKLVGYDSSSMNAEDFVQAYVDSLVVF